MNKLIRIPLERIRFDKLNPRTDGEENLDGLIASVKSSGLVQPPIVLEDGEYYRVLVGERRLRAARQAGMVEIECLVADALDPISEHRFRVAENLNRKDLNPVALALSLRVSWLLANAEAIGLGEEAKLMMKQNSSLENTRVELENLLESHGFRPQTPAVTWEQMLDELGIEMNKERRKKLLRLLAIPPDIQERLRNLPITEAAARSLGMLDEETQRQVVAAIEDDHRLAQRARRISRAVRDLGYSVEEALAEARGEIVEAPPPQNQEVAFENDNVIVDAIMSFLDASNQMLSALARVREVAHSKLDIPALWRNHFENALSVIRDEIEMDVGKDK